MAYGRPVYEIAFATAPKAATPTWTELSPRLRSQNVISAKRGRQNQLQRFTPGTMTVYLRNEDRALDSDNGSSPYVGNLKPNRKCRLSMEYPWLPGLLANPSFVGTLTPWVTISNATAAIDTLNPYLGGPNAYTGAAGSNVASDCLVTATASGGGGIRSGVALISAGQTLVCSARVRTTVAARSALFRIEWFTDAAGTVANGSTVGTSQPLVQNAYTRLGDGPFTAPASTQSFKVRVEMTGTWNTNDTMNVDDVVADIASFQGLGPIMTAYVDRFTQDGDNVKDAWATVPATDGFKLLSKDRIGTSGYKDKVLADSPSHYWRFSEGAGDFGWADSGTGTPQRMNPIGSPSAGRPGAIALDTDSAIGVDGSNAAAAATGTTPLAFPFTLEFWCRWTGGSIDGAVTTVPILFWGNPADTVFSNLQFMVGWYPPFNDLLYWLHNAGAGVAANPSGVNITDGNWHQVSFAFTSTTTFYVIDNVGGLANVTNSPAPLDVPLQVSVDGQPGWYPWKGDIDEVAIYPGVSVISWAAHFIAASGWGVELSGTRLNRLLDINGWPTADRNIDPGVQNISPATNSLISTQMLQYMQEIEDAEAGRFFIQKNGFVRLIGRRAVAKAPYTTVQAIFGTGTGEIPFSDVSPGPTKDDQNIINHAEVTTDAATAVVQTVDDVTSQTDYGIQDISKTGVRMTNDVEALSYAQYLVNTYKTPVPRIESVKFKLVSDAAWAEAFNREIGDLISVRLRYPRMTPGTYVEYLVFVEGISHAIKRGVWEVTYAVNGIGVQPGWLVLNDAVLGKLNTGKLAF